MKNFTSILGWLLLIAVLAVPSFLFYNWWSKGNQQNMAEMVHEPMAGSVFPSERTGQGVPARQPSAVPAQGPGPAAQPLNSAAATAPASPAAPVLQPAPVPAGQPPSASSRPPAEALPKVQAPEISTAAARTVETSTKTKIISYYNPKSTRDPTFSPDDYRRIKEEQLRREEMERQQKMVVEVRKPREPKPETRINLQGLVGNAAIINGDMYTVGQTVRGVKILKIGADYIIGEYKGKTFRKLLK